MKTLTNIGDELLVKYAIDQMLKSFHTDPNIQNGLINLWVRY